MRIRPASACDLDALLGIQQAAPEAAQWSRSSLASWLEGSLVAEIDGVVVGFLIHRAVAGDETEILNLAVEAAHRRRGAATALIGRLVAQSTGDIFLEVRESNSAARVLYRRFGFREAAVRAAYYHRPVENGLVLKLTRSN